MVGDRTLGRLAIAAGLALAPRAARAQGAALSVANAAAREATVVQLDATDLVVDTGALAGVVPGAIYQIYRPVVVRHPITNRVLRDRFPIGTVRIHNAGAALSMARPEGALARTPAVGDILVPVDPPAARPQPPRERAAPARADAQRPREQPQQRPQPLPLDGDLRPDVVAAGVPDADRALLAAWVASLGQPPERRVELYRAFLRDHPASPHATSVRREILALAALTAERQALTRRLAAAQRETARVDEDRDEPRLPATLQGDPLATLRPGDVAVVAFQLGPRQRYSAGVLHARRRGDPVYQQVPLALEGDDYLRAEVPRAMVQPPGYEYFVELVGEGGRAIPVVGNADAPIPVAVEAPPAPTEAVAGRSRVDVRGEYADVGSIPGRPEYFVLTEADFFQRVAWGGLYGYRVGFGLYRGEGQPLAAYGPAGAMIPTRAASVLYGYHELEFAASDFVHVMARLEVGTDEAGLLVGTQARVRIGRERGTNIVVGGDVLDRVGQRAFFAFNFFPHPRAPMLAQGEVFNQVIDGGDPMFRLVYQAGWRFSPWGAVAARASYQLRNIEHGGFGAGLALTFDW